MSVKPVRKAIIAAAGMGTRFLPQTKAMPKEMLPIIDKPVIQWVVENVVSAGVEDVIIVTGTTKRAIEDHFDRALELEEELESKGKSEIAQRLEDIANLANFVYIRQKGIPKGNARPVLNASHLIGDEPFFFMFADDFFTGTVPSAKQMLDAYKKTGAPILALREVNDEETKKYGIVEGVLDDNGLYKVNSIVEKPGPSATSSRLASVSGYLLTPDIIPILEQEKVGNGGEIVVVDSINELAKSRDVYGVKIDGAYHDTGSPDVYLQTLIDVALKDDKLGPSLREYLKTRLEN